MDNRRCSWAVRRVGSHDLGGIDGRVAICSIGTSCKGSKGNNGETHLVDELAMLLIRGFLEESTR